MSRPVAKPRMRPVVFVRICCEGEGVAGLAATGGIYYRKTTWLSDKPWLFMPPPMELAPATKRRASAGRRRKKTPVSGSKPTHARDNPRR